MAIMVLSRCTSKLMTGNTSNKALTTYINLSHLILPNMVTERFQYYLHNTICVWTEYKHSYLLNRFL